MGYGVSKQNIAADQPGYTHLQVFPTYSAHYVILRTFVFGSNGAALLADFNYFSAVNNHTEGSS